MNRGMKMDPNLKKNTVKSIDIPVCPNCKEELPVPGIEDEEYRCPSCGIRYVVDAKSVRIFKTEMVS